MYVYFFKGATSLPYQAECVECTASDLLDTIAEWPSNSCQDEEDKKRGWGVVCAKYKPNATSKSYSQLADASSTEVLIFDLDNLPEKELSNVEDKLAILDCVLYSTYKHTPQKPRYRLVARLDKPINTKHDEPFRTIYNNVAELLGITPDTSAAARANLYFLPQHQLGVTPVNKRFNGAALPVDELLKMSTPVPRQGASNSEQIQNLKLLSQKPEKSELKKLATRLAKSQKEARLKAGIILSAVLRKEPYAEDGNKHNAALCLAYALTNIYPHLDAAWFAETYLMPCWENMGAEETAALRDWLQAVTYGQNKRLEAKEKNAQEASAVDLSTHDPKLSPEQIQNALNQSGTLINSFRSSYYLFSAVKNKFLGPLKGHELPTVFRDHLRGVPGMSESEYTEKGKPRHKTASVLTHQYGKALDAVHFYHSEPPCHYSQEENAIKIQAYNKIKWEPKRHEIAEDLLKALGGSKYDLLEKWLYKFCDLDQALPALTLIGPPSTWKSQVAQILSRFWGSRDTATACRASQVLLRFGDALLKNPVIWSDEQLAKTDSGKEIPERYRESITSPSQQIECKGLAPVTLFSHTRHVITANSANKIFTSEYEADAVAATMERFLTLEISKQAIDDFEARWKDTEEMAQLREGRLLLEHVAWIQAHKQYVGTCRLFVETRTDSTLLNQASFANPYLSGALSVCVEKLMNEKNTTKPGDLSRLPMFLDAQNQLRVNTATLIACWNNADSLQGMGLKKPSPIPLGKILSQSGVRIDSKQASENHRKRADKGWKLSHERFREFLDSQDLTTWEDINEACLKIWGRTPTF